LRTPFGFPALTLFAVVFFLLISTHAQAQYVVDCTGNTPGAYTTINSVLPLLSDGSVVRITGPCSEKVTIGNLSNLWIGAPWGQTAVLNGNLTINGVRNLFLHGLNVTNANANIANGDGIDINNSSNVEVDDCTSSNNSNVGLKIGGSLVSIQDTGAFDNNGNDGITASGSTDLSFSGYAGIIDVSNNLGDGIRLEDGFMEGGGNLNITGNKPNPSVNLANLESSADQAGYGIDFWGHERGVMIGLFGPNIITGNQSGGAAIHEGSEIAFCCTVLLPAGDTYGNIISGNGPVGVSVGFGSQASIWTGAEITGHTDAGVEVYGHSQVLIDGPVITNNGTGLAATYPTRANVRVDGTSEADIAGGQISGSSGPGILALVNSSIDLSGTTLTSNAGGPIQCDSSAWLTTGQPVSPAPFGFAQPCRVPTSFGPHFHAFAPPTPNIDLSRIQADEAKYRKLISSF
jgi:hypothetical protein